VRNVLGIRMALCRSRLCLQFSILRSAASRRGSSRPSKDVDTSSGSLGGAVYGAPNKLLPIAISAPADRKTRDKWLDRLWQAIDDDGVDYLSLVGNRWADLCSSGEVASGPRRKAPPLVAQRTTKTRAARRVRLQLIHGFECGTTPEPRWHAFGYSAAFIFVSI